MWRQYPQPRPKSAKNPLTEDDIAVKANADIDQASDAERAFQKENPVGKPAGKKPDETAKQAAE